MFTPLQRKRLLVRAEGWAPYPLASAHFDFVHQRYFWASSQRSQTDFTTFTTPLWGPAGEAAGLAPNSNTAVTLAFSAIGLSNPFVMATVMYQSVASAALNGAAVIDDGSSAANAMMLQQNNATGVTTTVNTASATVVSAPSTAGTFPAGAKAAVAASFATNNTVSSMNGGVNGMTTDTVCAMPTVTTIRFGRRSAGNNIVSCSLRHVLFFAGAMTQAQLDALTFDLQRY